MVNVKRLIVGLVLLVGMPFWVSSTAVSQAQLPEGFILTVVQDGLERPLDTEVLPDGSLLIAEKGDGETDNGTARVQWSRDGEMSTILTLSVNTKNDSGILGIIPDPGFATNKQFYVWYATGISAMGYVDRSTVRLSRFTLDMESAQAAGEQVIFDAETWNIWHMGGGLVFDDEGNLYLSIGDIANHTMVQDLSQYRGKVLRIRPTADGYTIPADNPFIDVPNAHPEIYAYGFRNPYRMARHSDGRIVVGDVGRAHWEEINVLKKGANYGWSEREGMCPIGEEPPCAAAGSQFTDPEIAYPHEIRFVEDQYASVGAITALAFYEGEGYPEAYHDQLFLSDSALGWINLGDLQSGEMSRFGDSGGIVDADYANDRIFLTQFHTGRIYALEHTGQLNSFPSVSLDVSETLGAAPFEVVFEATPFDADGEEMTLLWDFGDGTPPISGEAGGTVVTHTYMTDGVYTPMVTVTDEQDGSTSTTEQITVYSGELPQIRVDNVTNAERERYWAGDGVRMTAVRSTTDGLAETPYTWNINLRHNIHKHSLFSGVESADYSFFIPTENHDGDWALWYEILLTMHTADGLDITISEEIFPQYVDLTFTADAPVVLTINRIAQQPPHTFRSIVGMENEVITPMESVSPAGFFDFNGWNTGNGVTLDIVAPAIETTWTAAYTFDKVAHAVYLPSISRID